MDTGAPSPDQILQTGLAFWASKALLSAVEMGVFTELASGPEELTRLTGRLGLHPRSAKDFLDALVAMGFLERSDGNYSNTPSTDLFLDKHKPTYVGGMLEMANSRLFRYWSDLTTGPANRSTPERSGPWRTRTVCRTLRGSRATETVFARNDRNQPWSESGNRC